MGTRERFKEDERKKKFMLLGTHKERDLGEFGSHRTYWMQEEQRELLSNLHNNLGW